MLPLLSKIAAYVSGAPEIRIGVALGRNLLRASILGKHDGTWQVARVQAVPVPVSLFEGEPSSATTQALAQALTSLLPEAVENFVPLHLAVPGAVTSLRVFSLDTIPKAEKDRINLVRWRLAQELGVNYELACAYQIHEESQLQAGGVEGGGTLLGSAIDARWLECLNEACSAAHIVPTVIDGSFSSLFNHFHSEIKAFREHSALICLEPESWSLLVIDEQARVRLARSWWRDPGAGSAAAADYDAIALEVEQAIRAYTLMDATPVKRVAIAGEGADISALAVVLNQRMQQPCHMLAVMQGGGANRMRPEYRGFSSALAAAFDFR